MLVDLGQVCERQKAIVIGVERVKDFLVFVSDVLNLGGLQDMKSECLVKYKNSIKRKFTIFCL
jgi:hypothetical protein